MRLNLVETFFHCLPLNDAVSMNFRLGGTSISAITDSPVSSKISNNWRMQGVSLSIRSSANITAKGSSPTKSRAQRTAWPKPSGFFCRTGHHLGHFRDPPRAFRPFLSVLRSVRTCSSSGRLIEVIFDAVLAAAGDEDDFLDSRVNRLLYDVLNGRDIDDRQKLFRHGLWSLVENACLNPPPV